jgi:acyl-CoA dehydrogenase
LALIAKFIPNYFFNHQEYPFVPMKNEPVNDNFLFCQGPARGLGKITFHDYHKAYESYDLPNVEVFMEQIETFKSFLTEATPDETQRQDFDFSLPLVEIFTLIVYGQLILENATIYNVDRDIVDQIFDFMVRDFSNFALELHNKPSSTPEQMDFCSKMLKKPAVDQGRYQRVWKDHVHALKGVYEMND